MRMAFGLVGLLIGLAVFVWVLGQVFLPHTQQVIKSGNQARAKAQQWAGVDENGMRAADSIIMEPIESGTKITGILVKTIHPTGPMANYFGLQRNDTIVKINGAKIGEFELADEE